MQAMQVIQKEVLLLLYDIVGILDYFKRRWFPKRAKWVRITIFFLTFFFGTVVLGVGLNLIADYIAKFWLHW
jgi:hypothetical protein